MNHLGSLFDFLDDSEENSPQRLAQDQVDIFTSDDVVKDIMKLPYDIENSISLKVQKIGDTHLIDT